MNTIDRTTVLNALIKLAEAASVKANSFYKGNPHLINIIEMEYRPIKDINYNIFSTHFNLDRGNYKRTKFCELKILPMTEFIQNEILESDKCKEALELLFKWVEKQIPINNPDFLKNFLKANCQVFVSQIVRTSIPNILIKEEIENYAVCFLRDNTKDDFININVELYLRYLSLENEQIILGNNLTLRKPLKGDFEEWTTDFHEREIEMFTQKSTNITSVLTINFQIQNNFRVDHEYNKIVNEEYKIIINIIRLYSVNSAYEINYRISSNSISHSAFIIPKDYPISEYPETTNDTMDLYYQIKEVESPNLQKFIEKIYPILSKIILESSDGNPYSIAYHSYQDALLQSELRINKITQCVYCLDAIFNEYKPRKGQKIIQNRILYFLSLLFKKNKNDIKTLFDIESAFEIRNQFSHKTIIDEPLKEFSRQNTRSILDYTRIVLIGFLQLSPVLNKEELLQRLDAEGKDKAIENELINIIEQNVFIPNL